MQLITGNINFIYLKKALNMLLFGFYKQYSRTFFYFIMCVKNISCLIPEPAFKYLNRIRSNKRLSNMHIYCRDNEIKYRTKFHKITSFFDKVRWRLGKRDNINNLEPQLEEFHCKYSYFDLFSHIMILLFC